MVYTSIANGPRIPREGETYNAFENKKGNYFYSHIVERNYEKT